MNDILEQAAIDSLLKGLGGDAGEPDAPQHDASPPLTQYDFSRQGRIVRGRMPTLEMINERFARSLRLSLFRLLDRSPEVVVLGVSTLRYSDYNAGLSVPTSLNLIRLQPLSGLGLMVFEAKLIFALLDNFYGGSGRHAKIEGRDFTFSEEHIIDTLLEMAIAGVEHGWSPVLSTKVEFINREMNPQLANLVSPTETVLVSRLRVSLDGKGGEIHVTLPYGMLEPLKDTLRAGIQSDRVDREERWSHQFRNELEESEVELIARLGSARTTVQSLANMSTGDIIPCDLDGSMAIVADGMTLFKGTLESQNGRQAVRIAEIARRKTGNSLDSYLRRA